MPASGIEGMVRSRLGSSVSGRRVVIEDGGRGGGGVGYAMISISCLLPIAGHQVLYGPLVTGQAWTPMGFMVLRRKQVTSDEGATGLGNGFGAEKLVSAGSSIWLARSLFAASGCC